MGSEKGGPSTHWDGCWRAHHSCAIHRLEKLSETVREFLRFERDTDRLSRAYGEHYHRAVRIENRLGRLMTEEEDAKFRALCECEDCILHRKIEEILRLSS